MIGLSGAAGAVLVLCGQVRSALERKGLPRRELAGGRVRIEPRYNQGSGFGLFPLKARHGRVLDYLRFPRAPGPLKKYTYNLADLAILLGAVLLVLRPRRR